MWCILSFRDTLRVPVQRYSAESILQTDRKRCLLVAKAALWGGLNTLKCQHCDSVSSAGNLLSSQPSFQLFCIFEFKGKHELSSPLLGCFKQKIILDRFGSSCQHLVVCSSISLYCGSGMGEKKPSFFPIPAETPQTATYLFPPFYELDSLGKKKPEIIMTWIRAFTKTCKSLSVTFHLHFRNKTPKE